MKTKQVSASPKSLMSVSNRAANPRTATSGLFLRPPISWLSCCFAAFLHLPGRQAFVLLFHPLACPLRVFFFSATSSSLWTCSRKHREKRRRIVQKVATFGQRNWCCFYGRGALLVCVVGGTQNMGTGLELLPQLLRLLELGEKMNQEEDLACEGIQHLPEGELEEFKSAFCI